MDKKAILADLSKIATPALVAEVVAWAGKDDDKLWYAWHCVDDFCHYDGTLVDTPLKKWDQAYMKHTATHG